MTFFINRSNIVEMPGELGRCLMETYVEYPVALSSTISEFIVIVGVVACGLVLNYRFLLKLKEEKRKRQQPPKIKQMQKLGNYGKY